MIDFQHGDLVRLEDDDGPVTDEQGRVLDGMTGRLDRMTPFYAYVALTCWPGVVVRVLRRSLVLVNSEPETAQETRERLRWERDAAERWAA